MDELKVAAIVAHAVKAAWDEAEHPRHPEGSPDGGKFAPKSGGSSGVAGLVKEIQTGLDNFAPKGEEKRLASDRAEVRARLKSLDDLLFGQGEYEGEGTPYWQRVVAHRRSALAAAVSRIDGSTPETRLIQRIGVGLQNFAPKGEEKRLASDLAEARGRLKSVHDLLFGHGEYEGEGTPYWQRVVAHRRSALKRSG